MENGHLNGDDGELFSTSQAAIAAAKRRVEAEEADLLGTEKLMLAAALMAAVAELPEWVKTETPNEAFKKGGKALKYASLKDILTTVRPSLHKNDIRIRQGVVRSYELNDGPGSKGRLVIIYTDLVHAPTGEVDRTLVEIPIMRMDAQAMGSALTYGRRYSLLAALGLATDEADDDGESAKLNKLSDAANDSDELAKLTIEMRKIKSPSQLVEWSNEPAVQKRFSQLDEGERVTLKHRYDAFGQELLADDAPAKKGKS